MQTAALLRMPDCRTVQPPSLLDGITARRFAIVFIGSIVYTGVAHSAGHFGRCSRILVASVRHTSVDQTEARRSDRTERSGIEAPGDDRGALRPLGRLGQAVEGAPFPSGRNGEEELT